MTGALVVWCCGSCLQPLCPSWGRGAPEQGTALRGVSMMGKPRRLTVGQVIALLGAVAGVLQAVASCLKYLPNL